MIIPEGGSTTLNCSHINGIPIWFKGRFGRIDDGTPCSCTVSVQGLQDSSLEFMDFQRIGTGDYGCWVPVSTGVFDRCSFEVQLAGKEVV